MREFCFAERARCVMCRSSLDLVKHWGEALQALYLVIQEHVSTCVQNYVVLRTAGNVCLAHEEGWGRVKCVVSLSR